MSFWRNGALLAPIMVMIVVLCSNDVYGFDSHLEALKGFSSSANTCPEPLLLEQSDEQEVRIKAERLLQGYLLADVVGWEIANVNGDREWAVITISPIIADEQVGGDADILLGRKIRGEWFVVLPNSESFSDWLSSVPNNLLIPPPERGIFAVSRVPTADTNGIYKLPYTCGEAAYVLRSQGGHDNAVDFAIANVSNGANHVVAAQSGWVHAIRQDRTTCCCNSTYSSNYVILRHENGEYSYYVHLAANSVVVSVGQWVIQGAVIAREGDVGYTCSSLGGRCQSRHCPSGSPSSPYCCEHLHFEVRNNGSWSGSRLNPRFHDIPGQYAVASQTYVSGNCGGTSCCGCTAANQSISEAIPSSGELVQAFTPIPKLKQYQLTNTQAISLTAVSLPTETWHGLSGWSAEIDRRKVVLSTNDPVPPFFVWPEPLDSYDGALGYWVYWGDHSDGVGEFFVTQPVFSSNETVNPSRATVRYLRVATGSSARILSAWYTAGVWRYDPIPPRSSLFTNNGEGSISTQYLTLNIDATDDDSSVSGMRFSHDGQTWTEWEPYAPWKQWQLQDTPDLQTIYAQVQDAAGNVSEIMQATVRVELEMARPSSPNYTLARSVLGMGGGRKTSTSYQVQGTSGQVQATSQMQSTEYQVASGFWAGITTAPCYDFGGEPGVGIYDVITVSERWNGAYDPTFDLDHDGDIDIVDIMMVAAAWGNVC